MNDPLPTTLARGDTVNEEIDDSTKSERDPKDDSMVLAQLAVEGPVTPLAPSTDNPPFDPSAQDAQNSPAKADENPYSQHIQNLLA